MTTIRPGTSVDITKVSHLWLEMVKELAPDYTPRPDWWRKIATEGMKMGNYFFHVAEHGQTLVGFLDSFLFPEPSTGKLHAVGQHFYLKPEYRGNGIAGRLYRKGNAVMRKKGATVFELFTFDAEKPMWARKGFAPVRTLMRKEIHHV